MVSQTTLQFNLPETRQVNIAITDGVGRVVREVLDESMSAGDHTISIDSQNLAAGLYFVMIRTGIDSQVIKLNVA